MNRLFCTADARQRDVLFAAWNLFTYRQARSWLTDQTRGDDGRRDEEREKELKYTPTFMSSGLWCQRLWNAAALLHSAGSHGSINAQACPGTAGWMEEKQGGEGCMLSITGRKRGEIAGIDKRCPSWYTTFCYLMGALSLCLFSCSFSIHCSPLGARTWERFHQVSLEFSPSCT